MSAQLRLLTRAQRETLDDSQLHHYLRKRYGDEVRSITQALATEFASEAQAHLDEVCRRLAERLRSMDDLRHHVQDEVDTGGTTLTTVEQFFEALAAWVIDNQSDEVTWHPGRRLKRRKKGLWSFGGGD